MEENKIEDCNSQQDPLQFLLFLFNIFSNPFSPNFLKLSKPESEFTSILSSGEEFYKNFKSSQIGLISDNFTGIFLKTLTCSSKNCNKTYMFETFSVLNLIIDEEYDCIQTLGTLIDSFCKEDIIIDDHKCCNCQNKLVSFKTEIYKLPNLLILQTCRFNLQNMKINKKIKFPSSSYFRTISQVENKKKFSLHSFISTHGKSLYDGHFTCTRKIRENFFLFNDEYEPIKLSETQIDYFLSSSSYLLFYSLEKDINFSISETFDFEFDQFISNINPLQNYQNKNDEFTNSHLFSSQNSTICNFFIIILVF